MNSGPGNSPQRETRLLDRFRRRALRQRVAEVGRGGARRQQKIDRAADAGAQSLGREARDGADARSAAGELRPVLRNADAEGSDDPYAGDDDNRAAVGVEVVHAPPPSARKQDHALPVRVADAGDDNLPQRRRLLPARSARRSSARKRPVSRSASAARATLAGAVASIEWPMRPPAPRTKMSCAERGRSGTKAPPRWPALRPRRRKSPRRDPAAAEARASPIACGRISATAPEVRRWRSESAGPTKAATRAPRFTAWSAASSTRKAPTEPRIMPPPRAARDHSGAGSPRMRAPQKPNSSNMSRRGAE